MHPSPSEASRLAALRRYQILDTAPEPVFDELVRTAARLFDTPIALISLVDESRQWFKASVGLDMPQTAREFAFCARTIQGADVLVVPDALADPRFADNPLVAGPPGIRFYAAAPLITRGGPAIGALCIIDTKPRPGLTRQACDTLAALARVVVAEFDSRLSALETLSLIERQERLTAAAIAIARCTDRDGILRVAADEAAALLDAKVAFAVAAIAGQDVDVAAAGLSSLSPDEGAGMMDFAKAVERSSLDRGGVVRLDDGELRATTAKLGVPVPSAAGLDSWMAVPLRQGADGHLGALIVGGGAPLAPSDEALLAQLGQLLSGALHSRLHYERAQAAERRFRVLFQRNPNPMWVFDRQTLKFLEVNDAAIELYGWSREEFLRMTVLDLRSSQDVPRLLAVLESMNDGMRHHGEWQHINRHGDILHVLIAAYYGLEHEGRAAGLTVVHDITERKRIEQALAESEARFHNIADSIPAMLWVDAPNNETVFVNRQWLDYSGRRLADEIGDGWQDLLHPDDRAAALERIYGACGARVPYETEYRLRRHDGEYRWFLDTGSPRFSPDGSFLGYYGILLDITERRRLEAEVRQFQKMEAIGRLTGGIAHDFNNLLCVILGNSEMIAAETEDNAYLNRLANMARTAADRGACLVGRLLAFSRGQTLQPIPTSVNDLIAEMNDLLRRTLGEDIDVVLDLQDDAWTTCVDPEQLETALLNLAINARDAMADGGRLTIATANLEVDGRHGSDGAHPGEYVCVTVSDNGCGMSDEVASRAFEPFFTTKDVDKGTGLGLSMVYGFAQHSRGHVSLHSKPGLGTSVRILLPRAAARAEAAPIAAASRDRCAPAAADATILLVEDDPLVRDMLGGQLEQMGYEVLAAEDGPSGLALLHQHPHVDLLLTDMVMPGGMTGRQLAEAARSLRPELRILFMSGYTEERIAGDEGLSSHGPLMRKPFTRKTLADAVESALAPRAA